MSRRDGSTQGLPMSLLESIDLSVLGTRAAVAMCGGDTSYRAFQAACGVLFEELGRDLEQVRLYLLDPAERILREEAMFDHDGGQQGSDLVPIYQLPEDIVHRRRPVQQQAGEQWEILVPLPAENLLAGVLALVSYQKVPSHVEEKLARMARSLALGVLYVLRSRQAERANFLLKAVTHTSRDLLSQQGTQALLETLASMAVDELGFDRATFFVLGEDGREVIQALCKRTGNPVMTLDTLPDLPQMGDQPSSHPNLPGLWIPIRLGARRLGTLFVDNIYSLEPPPRDAVQSLVDLAAQAALALENASLFDRLREAALRDDLTGLYRPGYFTERVQEELANSRRRNDGLGIMMMDLDHFKGINDTYGHPVGDEVLMRVADRIRSALRVGDIACRKGGDEFIVLVPGLSDDQASRMAQRLLDEVKSSRIELPDGRQVEMSLSIGISLFPQHADNWQELWQRADEALYQSKEAGRGCWSLWDPEKPVVVKPAAHDKKRRTK